MTVAKSKYGDRLIVDVDPNQGADSYAFRVQKRKGDGSWTTLPGEYATTGSAETRRVRLGVGTYRAVVEGRYGYRGATSKAVTLTERTVVVRARTGTGQAKLKVDVDPNRGSGFWTFKVQKRRANGSWRTVTVGYRTWGKAERRTLDLGAGRYRVVVAGKYGYLGARSTSVRLVR